MTTDHYERIRRSPNYIQLSTTRGRISWRLTLLTLFSYLGFLLTFSYAPDFMASALPGGGGWTVGTALGLSIMIVNLVISGWYVHRSNTEFDDLTRKIQEEFGK